VENNVLASSLVRGNEQAPAQAPDVILFWNWNREKNRSKQPIPSILLGLATGDANESWAKI
jgi:hypothetical protein